MVFEHLLLHKNCPSKNNLDIVIGCFRIWKSYFPWKDVMKNGIKDCVWIAASRPPQALNSILQKHIAPTSCVCFRSLYFQKLWQPFRKNPSFYVWTYKQLKCWFWLSGSDATCFWFGLKSRVSSLNWWIGTFLCLFKHSVSFLVL